ncbi:hypothetical protein EC973_006085 [Apophysomyces ossiformis]|uniref:Uncharacterized protein n=1 Tax=Apophysomyces ossiformis TaxID=679940 RepID=A0A8H7BJ43_9FUNG|nr:hypothetical protein EC973_006085 [Apophysomyces ossiformis]
MQSLLIDTLTASFTLHISQISTNLWLFSKSVLHQNLPNDQLYRDTSHAKTMISTIRKWKKLCLPKLPVLGSKHVITKCLIAAGLFGLIGFFAICKIDFNAHTTLRLWISPVDNQPPDSLSSCFSEAANELLIPRAEIVPSVPVTESYVCYDFASSLRPNPIETNASAKYHTFWFMKDNEPFSQNDLDILRSFYVTQNRTNTELTVWILREDEQGLVSSPAWQTVIKHSAKGQIKYKVVDFKQLVSDTPFASFFDPWQRNAYAGLDGLLRLLVLYQHGGVWFDLNTLFVRDMSPLFFHQDWITQGDCHTSTSGNPFDTVLLQFRRRSPYLCEMLHEAAKQINKDRTDASKYSFGSELYYRTYRKLLKHHVQVWSLLPWCFTNPSECYSENSLPRATSNKEYETHRLQQVFAYRLHGQWQTKRGSIFNDLVNSHRKQIDW